MASNTEITDHLKSLYAAYRHTSDIDAKGHFFSAECIQICRPLPSYAATDRETIVRYVREAAAAGQYAGSVKGKPEGDDKKIKIGYTIRPLDESEFVFEDDAVVAPTGFTASGLKRRAEDEGWVGMRVDILLDDGSETGMLVKVQYWWRKEGGGWIQILHDIMYMGPPDGTEGEDLLE